MSKPYRSHDEAVSESLRADPAFAAEYLNAVIEDGDQAELSVALRQRPVVDDAMVERALDANIPGGGQVRDFGLPRYAVLAALLAACQQDNGAKR